MGRGSSYGVETKTDGSWEHITLLEPFGLGVKPKPHFKEEVLLNELIEYQLM